MTTTLPIDFSSINTAGREELLFGFNFFRKDVTSFMNEFGTGIIDKYFGIDDWDDLTDDELDDLFDVHVDAKCWLQQHWFEHGFPRGPKVGLTPDMYLEEKS